MHHVPRIITLLNGSLTERGAIRSVFESIVQQPPSNFGSVSTNAPRVKHSELLKPVELLLTSHILMVCQRLQLNPVNSHHCSDPLLPISSNPNQLTINRSSPDSRAIQLSQPQQISNSLFDGIMTSRPGNSHIGKPLRVIDQGETMIDPVTFEDYIEGLRSSWNAQLFMSHSLELSSLVCCYESGCLMMRNCNNFSKEVLSFLNGSDVPDYILRLRSFQSSSDLIIIKSTNHSNRLTIKPHIYHPQQQQQQQQPEQSKWSHVCDQSRGLDQVMEL
ncbi:hypothetical protein PPACK8108_LOCUS365 [Phakopsora pachyrhizi]|uniref:PPPDE domain-containing protein n=1 Tax=Phakopsora pachyrhizi TaxID=170000 RepID=A0AAV0ADH6_PHAPC|nr:hypothetical protein PPACK8108_LOCUS365 [Phakopsora pachyrhizi]